MSLIDDKLCALSVIFFFTFFSGLLPIYFLRIWNRKKQEESKQFSPNGDTSSGGKRYYRRPSFFSLLEVFIYFGGGVLFGACFLLLIPEVRENVEAYYLRVNVTKSDQTENNETPTNAESNKIDYPYGLPFVELAVCLGFFCVYFLDEMVRILIECKVIFSSEDYDTIPFNEHPNDVKETSRPSRLRSKLTSPYVRFIRGLVIVIAFSVHCVFEGVAIGLQSTAARLWTLMFAICSHKLVVSVAVGLELYEQTKTVAMTFLHLVLLSLITPVGIAIVLLTEQAPNEPTTGTALVLSALASGTVLYIVFFDVLQRDANSRVPGLVQFVAMILGFTLLVFVTLVADK